MEYYVDSKRLDEYKGLSTGIYVTAKTSKGASWEDAKDLNRSNRGSWIVLE